MIVDNTINTRGKKMDFISLANLIAFNEYDITKLKAMGISMKKREPETFIGFLEYLINEKALEQEILHLHSDDFFIDFSIPQISKEFDFIRLGDNYNINIELKSSATEEKQKEQLKKNYYYLNFLSSPTVYLSFSFEEKRLVIAKPVEGKLEFIDSKSLKFEDLFKNQIYTTLTSEEMEASFDIKNYLVSPFNNTDRFIHNEYFLTDGQNNIKKEIIESDKTLFSIQGGPGTGKSLLLYDIAHTLTLQLSQREVIVIHSGKLNQGHIKLKRNCLNIISASEYLAATSNKDLKYVLIDEAQRFYPNQLKEILAKHTEHSYKIVFSFDQEQAFDRYEVKWNNEELILNSINEFQGKKFNLKNKFRNNKELSMFITNMTNFAISLEDREQVPNLRRNIKLKYFRNYMAAESYIEKIGKDYRVLSYSPSMHTPTDPFKRIAKYGPISHDIIGQEFDNVAIIVDHSFFYKENETSTRYRLRGTDKSFYLADRMFYQNITRAKEQLLLIVINNQDFFGKVSSLLSNI